MSGPSSVVRSCVPSAPKASKDLTPDGVIPIPEGVPDRVRCDGPGTAAEYLVVTSEEDGRILRVGKCAKPRIRLEVRGRPLPDVADHLLDAERAGPCRERADASGMSATGPEVRAREVWRSIAPGKAPNLPLGSRCRRLLPLGLGRKSTSGPARVRVGLVPADVTHRLVQPHRLPDAEPASLPAIARAAPEQRMRELLRLAKRPARLGPVRSFRVTTVLQEGEELPVGDRKAVD